MHTVINALEDISSHVRFSSATNHDHTLLKDLNLDKDYFVVFDKAYNDYLHYVQ